MNFLEAWIALRYLRARKRSGFVSFISVISILGISVGVIALILVLSVMNGFQKDVRGQLLKVAPHMQLMFVNPDGGGNIEELQSIAAANKRVLGAAPYVDGQALLANSGEVRGVQVKGVDPAQEPKVSEFADKLPPGGYALLKEGEFDIILGRGLADALGVKEGDKVTVMTPDGNVTPAGMVPRIKQFNLVGTVNTGIFAVDQSIALMNLKDAQVLYRTGGQVSGLQLKLSNPDTAAELTPTIVPAQLRDKVIARDWTFQNRDYFQAVEFEKKMMFVIMFCISAVAAINLISTLIMTVTEKQAAIAILRTLGLPPAGIMKIFFFQGALLGFVGTVAGVVLGVPLALNIGAILSWFEHQTGRKLINSEVYFLNYLPSHVVASDVAVIAAISFVLALLATLYPSWSASKTQPAEALRYE